MPSLNWLRASRAKWRKARARAQAKINVRNHQIKQAIKAQRGPGRAVKFLHDHAGWHEDAGRPNRAAWLDRWANDIGPWMVGQPWCGLAVWQAAKAAGTTLTKETVSTVAIRQHAINGTGGFKSWHPASTPPALGWVAIYGTGSPEHTGIYGGNGIVWEGNTSAGSSGSQNNGGGLYPRKLSDRRGWLLGWAEINWR